MALSDSTVEQPDRKHPSDPPGKEKKEKLLTKVIVRRLPPNMDQETFLNQISPVPSYDYFYMVKGDASLGEHSFARAYINFVNPVDIYDFKEKFDNYVFLDSAGHEYPAVVEYGAFQKIPKRRNKVRMDPKIGSIESDLYYQEFVEMINKPPEQDEKPEYSYQITNENKETDTMTPLLEYIKHKKAERMRIREERREERKRKEFERKKFRDDERKKRYEDKSPVKSKHSQKSVKENETTEEVEKVKTEDQVEEKEQEKIEKPYYKNREKKFDDRRSKEVKSKYPPKKEYVDKREYKRRDDYKEYRPSKYEEYKKDDLKIQQKKVKKYSEKREERKMEAQKKSADAESTSKVEEKATRKSEEHERETKEEKNKDSDSLQKRIRNKDRPAIVLYRPGMLSKRKQQDPEVDSKDGK